MHFVQHGRRCCPSGKRGRGHRKTPGRCKRCQPMTVVTVPSSTMRSRTLQEDGGTFDERDVPAGLDGESKSILAMSRLAPSTPCYSISTYFRQVYP